jgi:hypothetical protein
MWRRVDLVWTDGSEEHIASIFRVENPRARNEREQVAADNVVQTGSEVHLAFCPMGTGGSFPGGEADHSPPTSAEVKETWICTYTPPDAFTAQCLIS